MSEIEALREALEQERSARKEAERLLEERNQFVLETQRKFEEAHKDVRVRLEYLSDTLAKSESLLTAASEQLEAVLDAVPGCVSWIDKDLRFRGGNQYFADILDIPSSDISGLPVGYTRSGKEFLEFAENFFESDEHEMSRDIVMHVREEERVFFVAARKYLDDRAAVFVGMDVTENKRAETEIRRAREQEIEIGWTIQRELLHERSPKALDGLETAALTIPSKSIDGDFYDFIEHDPKCLDVVIGDAMGKGIPAALVSAAMKSSILRSHIRLADPSSHESLITPASIMTQTAKAMVSQLVTLETFLTLCYARFELEYGRATLVDCGHTNTIHYRRDEQKLVLIEGENMPLGVLEDEVLMEIPVLFGSGDVFLFYSDGVTEAQSPTGEFFGEKLLADLVKAKSDLSASELVQSVCDEVRAFSGSDTFRDDLTIVAVKITGDVGGAKCSFGRMEVKSDLSELPAIRGFVRECCENAPKPLAPDQLDELILAVQEAGVNIIKHAYDDRADENIDISVRCGESEIEVIAVHHGKEFDPATVPLPTFDGSKESGFGVYIIEQFTDEVRYETDETEHRIVMLKRLA